MSYTYQGEYEDLIDWIIDSYPPEQYKKEGFFSWLKDVKNDFRESGHHFSNDIKDEMKQLWIDNSIGKLGKPDKDERNIKRAMTFNRLIDEDLVQFTTKDATEANPQRPKSSVRRELQELVKEGRLKRVERGVYEVT